MLVTLTPSIPYSSLLGCGTQDSSKGTLLGTEALQDLCLDWRPRVCLWW